MAFKFNEKSLKLFEFERFLNDDPNAIAILGSYPVSDKSSERAPAIIRVAKTPLQPRDAADIIYNLGGFQFQEQNDIYLWLFGWINAMNWTLGEPDFRIDIIYPATEAHIRKYTKQTLLMVRETPRLYEQIVKPYIDSFPPSRTQWVEDILSGKSEADKVIYRDASPDYGFVILPDAKWDLTTLSTLYLVAIAHSRSIRSLRDLNKTHLGMLQSIRREAERVVQERWVLPPGSTRLYVHYQPSYYHFHVHIVNANQSALAGTGMSVGQAHLLDDIISLLELDADDGPSIFQRMTLTYGLGDQHGLYDALKAAQNEL
ncbi:hypothetical protein PLICRDRAFT_49092 [Plicaturopsis crispa FD-325 SS-3]|nr:hypothetical protein PLICRDRAFT_49092 [Plicaturopsis crispa FD-325 SS-3]